MQSGLGDVTFEVGLGVPWERGLSTGFRGDLHLQDGAFGTKSSLDGGLGKTMNDGGRGLGTGDEPSPKD